MEREQRAEKQSQIRELLMERNEQAREIERLKALLAESEAGVPVTQEVPVDEPPSQPARPRVIIPTIIPVRNEPTERESSPSTPERERSMSPTQEREYGTPRGSPDRHSEAQRGNRGNVPIANTPQAYLGNQVAKPPELEEGLKDVNVKKRSKALTTYVRGFERFVCATLSAPHGNQLVTAAKAAAKNVALERLRHSESAIAKEKITIACANFEQGDFHPNVLAYAGRVTPLILARLPGWAAAENDFLLGSAEAEIAEPEQLNELHRFANLLLTVYDSLGPRNPTELISVGRHFENPQNATQGLSGNEWPRALMEWYNDAKGAAETHGEHVVCWNRTAAGLTTYTDSLWQHLNPRESSELVNALNATGMQGLNPTKTEVGQYVTQLAAILRSAEGIKRQGPKGGKKGTTPSTNAIRTQPNWGNAINTQQRNDNQGPRNWGNQRAHYTTAQPGTAAPNWGRTSDWGNQQGANAWGSANFTSAGKDKTSVGGKGKPSDGAKGKASDTAKGKASDAAKGKTKGKSNDGCFICGASDHWSRECPNKSGKGKSNQNQNAWGRPGQGNANAPAGGAGWA